MQAVILAGGRGTRLLPYTVVFPKPMLPVGGQPIIQTIVTQLAKAGFRDIVISLGYLGDMIELFFREKKNCPAGVQIRYVRESEPLGTAGALSLIGDLSENFLVVNGDILSSLCYREMYEYHLKKKSILTVAVGRKEVSINLGVLTLDANEKVTKFEEKPTYFFSDNMGIYVYSREAVRYLEKNKRTDVNILIQRLIDDQKPVYGFRSNEPYYWIDIGQHAEYEKANIEFEKHKEKFVDSQERTGSIE